MKCVKIIPADPPEKSENPTGMHENGSGDSVGEEALRSKSFSIVHLDLTPLSASEKLVRTVLVLVSMANCLINLKICS